MSAIDSPRRHIYWIELNGSANTHIRRATYEGVVVTPEVLVGLTGLVARDIALDIESTPQKIYWTIPAAGKIMRSNLDGTAVEDFTQAASRQYFGIAVKPDGILPPPNAP